MTKLYPEFVYDPSLCETVLDLYRDGASSTKVATELGVTRTTYNSMRAAHPEFDQACEFGENLAEVALEDIALMGAKGLIKNFNNTILQFLIKSRYRTTYGDQKKDESDEASLLEQLTAGSLKLVREPK